MSSNTTIRRDDPIATIRSALQYISCCHPADYIAHMARAYEQEQSAAAKDAIATTNMKKRGTRPRFRDRERQ
jgi:fumarate hydratase class I